MESFTDEVKALREVGLAHHGLIYALGIARALTNLKVSVILKVLKDLPSTDCSDAQLMQLSEVLSRGRIGEAKALIASFKRASSGELEGYRRSTQYDMLKDSIGKNAAFNEVFEVNGKAFARNPNTGEVLSAEEASLLLRKSQDAIAKVEAEERPGSDEFLAKRLQATVAVETSNLLGPDNCELVCDMCRLPIPEDDLLPLDSCGHLLHSACIFAHIMEQVQALTFPVTCPVPNCRVEISTLDLKERLSAEDLSLYEQNSFRYYVQQHTGDLQSCPAPDCDFVFSWSGEAPEFECPLCNKSYCLNCRAEWHPHLTCEQRRSAH
jgi:hypothetical protein